MHLVEDWLIGTNPSVTIEKGGAFMQVHGLAEGDEVGLGIIRVHHAVNSISYILDSLFEAVVTAILNCIVIPELFTSVEILPIEKPPARCGGFDFVQAENLFSEFSVSTMEIPRGHGVIGVPCGGDDSSETCFVDGALRKRFGANMAGQDCAVCVRGHGTILPVRKWGVGVEACGVVVNFDGVRDAPEPDAHAGTSSFVRRPIDEIVCKTRLWDCREGIAAGGRRDSGGAIGTGANVKE